MTKKSSLGIKSWALEDRPREKMLLKGKEYLSDAELIAILLGSGNREDTAVELSKKILQKCQNNLYELGKMDLSELQSFNGIGEAKAVTITAALELGRRRKLAEPIENPKIDSSLNAFKLLQPALMDLQHEEFWILLLNKQLKVLKKIKISSGGVSATVVDAKIIFNHALKNLASAIILCHNHPSGSLRPSNQDKRLTQKIKSAGELMGITIADHLIITDNGYFSFADEGIL